MEHASTPGRRAGDGERFTDEERELISALRAHGGSRGLLVFLRTLSPLLFHCARYLVTMLLVFAGACIWLAVRNWPEVTQAFHRSPVVGLVAVAAFAAILGSAAAVSVTVMRMVATASAIRRRVVETDSIIEQAVGPEAASNHGVGTQERAEANVRALYRRLGIPRPTLHSGAASVFGLNRRCRVPAPEEGREADWRSVGSDLKAVFADRRASSRAAESSSRRPADVR